MHDIFNTFDFLPRIYPENIYSVLCLKANWKSTTHSTCPSRDDRYTQERKPKAMLYYTNSYAPDDIDQIIITGTMVGFMLIAQMPFPKFIYR